MKINNIYIVISAVIITFISSTVTAEKCSYEDLYTKAVCPKGTDLFNRISLEQRDNSLLGLVGRPLWCGEGQVNNNFYWEKTEEVWGGYTYTCKRQ